MKVYLRDLAFSSAREVEVTTNKKAIIIMVRFPRTPRKRSAKLRRRSRFCPKIFVLVLLRFFFLGADLEVCVSVQVPYRLLPKYHKRLLTNACLQTRLVRELEKKFSGRIVVIIAQRRILRKPLKKERIGKQMRPRSRTLTAVHDAILEDMVYPTQIVGKRTRVQTDGTKVLKVLLDPNAATQLEYKLDAFSTVYKKLTHKEATFEFPITPQE